MSWDIFVQDLPRDVWSVEDIPDSFVPRPIGMRSAVIARIVEIVPGVVFSDPARGVIDGPDFSIELNLGEAEQVEGVALHVRGGEGAVAVVSAIVEGLDCRALDASTGEFFDPAVALESFRRWRAYRDQIIR